MVLRRMGRALALLVLLVAGISMAPLAAASPLEHEDCGDTFNLVNEVCDRAVDEYDRRTGAVFAAGDSVFFDGRPVCPSLPGETLCIAAMDRAWAIPQDRWEQAKACESATGRSVAQSDPCGSVAYLRDCHERILTGEAPVSELTTRPCEAAFSLVGVLGSLGSPES